MTGQAPLLVCESGRCRGYAEQEQLLARTCVGALCSACWNLAGRPGPLPSTTAETQASTAAITGKGRS